MKILLSISAILLFAYWSFGQTIKVSEPVNLLALGDSYTIGQGVGVNERWPAQLMQALQEAGFATGELKIIAQTGWRTDNLKNAINQQLPLNGFNLVSLLIGVNNQYQGGTTQAYGPQFEDLLNQAIALAGYNHSKVFVLSIPDYAYTPFGNGNPLISQQIDAFNQVNRNITESYNVAYIDITPISRGGLANPALIAGDGLHPSGLMYSLWVDEIMLNIEKELSFKEVAQTGKAIHWRIENMSMVLTNLPGNGEISIISSDGRLVARESVFSAEGRSIPLDFLASGIYLFRFTGASGDGFSGKFYIP